ncbi:MAG TPA: GNAT family N-acetyltransferase [Allosphingosinicella sp.]
MIRRGATADAEVLTRLMHGSSAYRGEYARILEGYAVTAEQIARDVVFVAEQGRRVRGFYSLILGAEPELDLMFVADEAQGKGVGRMLFEHMRAEASRRGISRVRIVAHPPATAFYERMGAIRVGTDPPHGRVTWERPVLVLPTGRAAPAGTP